MVDTESYNRSKVQSPSYGGFELRKGSPTSIVVHSTSNSQKNTSFASEAKYLFESKISGAHYLVGKQAQIVCFLSPLKWAAWHAGNCQWAWQNARSIGVELHHSVGDAFYPGEQLGALRALLLSLMAQFSIPLPMVETHGQIAIAGPYSRKHDPDGWPHDDFILWRDRNLAPPPPRPTGRYCHVKGLPVYQRSNRTGPLWGYLLPGESVVVDDLASGHLADGRGFVDLNGLQVDA